MELRRLVNQNAERAEITSIIMKMTDRTQVVQQVMCNKKTQQATDLWSGFRFYLFSLHATTVAL